MVPLLLFTSPGGHATSEGGKLDMKTTHAKELCIETICCNQDTFLCLLYCALNNFTVPCVLYCREGQCIYKVVFCVLMVVC